MSLFDRLRAALGPDSVFAATEDVIMYEYDYGLDRAMPDLVALPRSTADVQLLVRDAQAAGVAIVARGVGTGISGGAVPARGRARQTVPRRLASIPVTNASIPPPAMHPAPPRRARALGRRSIR